YRSGYRVEWWSSTTAPDSADAAFSMWAGYLQGMHYSSSKGTNKLARCVRSIPHELPVIVHQGDVVMLSNETVTLDGSASYANGGAIASYQWFSQTLSISSSATATPRIVNPPVGEHLVRLTVTDSNYVEASSAFIVTVLPANQPPVAVFDIPDTVYYGDVVQLDGPQSYDADGYISRYEWYFNDWTSRYSTVLLSADDYQPGENTVRLQVRDNGGAYGELE